MNFSGISQNRFLGKLLRFPLYLIPGGLVIPIVQGPLKGKKWIKGSSVNGCWLGSYEYDKQRFFAKTIKTNSIVFDIGANVGIYSLLASMLVGKSGRVFSFEPVPSNIAYLKEHIQLNKAWNVIVIEAAVADCNGITTFQENESNSMGKISEKGNLTVKTIGIDKAISEGILPVPNYMKIDVEGAESLVIKGAKDTLARNHPILFLATHGEHEHTVCCDLLGSIGYKLQPIGSDSIDSTDEIMAF